MPKKFLRKYLPDPQRIKQNRSLTIFGRLLGDPNLWHMHRKSVSMAFFVGLFVMWIPLPSQMILAAGAAIILRCNLPLSVALVWITNPFTMGPMLYLAYRLGSLMMGLPPRHIEFEISLHWIQTQMIAIWQPLLLGSTTLGLISGTLGYITIRLLWRLHVVQYLKDKQLRIKKRLQEHHDKGQHRD